jgi:hypothetical protein
MTSRLVNVVAYFSGFPGSCKPDVDRMMDPDEAMKEYGVPDSMTANTWQYF